MKKAYLAGAAVAVLMAAVPTAASARTYGEATASGDEAIATSAAEVLRPRVIRLVVTSSPRQRVWVAWSMTCKSRSGKRKRTRDGSYRVRTPSNRRLRIPYRRASECLVAATAQLEAGGRLRVRIAGRSYRRR